MKNSKAYFSSSNLTALPMAIPSFQSRTPGIQHAYLYYSKHQSRAKHILHLIKLHGTGLEAVSPVFSSCLPPARRSQSPGWDSSSRLRAACSGPRSPRHGPSPVYRPASPARGGGSSCRAADRGASCTRPPSPRRRREASPGTARARAAARANRRMTCRRE